MTYLKTAISIFFLPNGIATKGKARFHHSNTFKMVCAKHSSKRGKNKVTTEIS